MHTGDSARENWLGLMERAQAGDQCAYTRLLRALVPVIRAQVRRRLSDEALTEDVIQDVLLTLHRVRHTYDPAYPFRPWLTAIVSARAVDALRRRGRQQHCALDDAQAADPASTAEQQNSRTAEQQQLDTRQELAGYLSQLPLRQREIVEHVHLHEMSLNEAAAHHNLSVSAVKSLLHRALINLRRFGANHD
ncbi:MAG: sigma-70 family RNA polymerase sigma factor [Pantoea sp. Pent]|nr:sigma-70 family RNA polymerase sigma factor [Pantoea sp. Pent]